MYPVRIQIKYTFTESLQHVGNFSDRCGSQEVWTNVFRHYTTRETLGNANITALGICVATRETVLLCKVYIGVKNVGVA
jgi:hypothetical protein